MSGRMTSYSCSVATSRSLHGTAAALEALKRARRREKKKKKNATKYPVSRCRYTTPLRSMYRSRSALDWSSSNRNDAYKPCSETVGPGESTGEQQWLYWLVVEDDVGQPDLLGRDIEYIDVTVLRRLPRQLVVEPFLQPPQPPTSYLTHRRKKRFFSRFFILVTFFNVFYFPNVFYFKKTSAKFTAASRLTGTCRNLKFNGFMNNRTLYPVIKM